MRAAIESGSFDGFRDSFFSKRAQHIAQGVRRDYCNVHATTSSSLRESDDAARKRDVVRKRRRCAKVANVCEHPACFGSLAECCDDAAFQICGQGMRAGLGALCSSTGVSAAAKGSSSVSLQKVARRECNGLRRVNIV
eukprot:IDg16095t1